MIMKKENERGITLIALVITIIVLIILASVGIAMLTGENGILNKASTAKEKHLIAQYEEELNLCIMEMQTDELGTLTMKKLIKELPKYIKASQPGEQYEWNEEQIAEEPIGIYKGYDFYVDKNKRAHITKKVTEKEDTSEIDYGTKIPGEDKRTVLEQATAAKPAEGTIDSSNNDPSTGIIMIDSKQNEWVWVEVPSTVFTSATSSVDYDNIKANLIEYATVYRGGYEYKDEFYTGCGLTQEEYTTKYQTMLSSIYTNKGFYIGRYEAGIEGSDTNVGLARDNRTEITNDSPNAVSKKDMIPYTYVYCSDAEKLAEGMATGNKTSSLMFGIQWDLVCKFLETKKISVEDIKENSTSWGNYSNSSFAVDSLKAQKCYPFGIITDKVKTGEMQLTTGASEYTKRINIYDFAGNVWELTLEKKEIMNPFTLRGGGSNEKGDERPASYRTYIGYNNSYSHWGFRSSLY